MKIFKLVVKTASENYGFNLTESKLRSDSSISDDDKDIILSLSIGKIHISDFAIGNHCPFAIKRIS